MIALNFDRNRSARQGKAAQLATFSFCEPVQRVGGGGEMAIFAPRIPPTWCSKCSNCTYSVYTRP